MTKYSHLDTPFIDAVKSYVDKNRTAFHMPGHARSRLIPEQIEALLGKNAFKYDLTEVEGVDYLHKAEGVLKASQELTAAAFGSEQVFYLVNGSTVGVMSMIMSSVKPGEKLIVQRNSHRCAIAGITLGNVTPIWIQPEMIPEYQILAGVLPETLQRTIDENPDAKAVLLTSPNYYGMAQNMMELIRIAHENDIIVLVDEAHGAHFPFHPDLPTSSIDRGADMITQSTHKSLPALTQTALLHVNGNRIDLDRLTSVLSMLQSSSPNYLLMMSIEASRKMMSQHGMELWSRAMETAAYAREELLKIPELQVIDESIVGKYGIVEWDSTKLSVLTNSLRHSGFEIEHLLNSQFNIEIELSALNNYLCFITGGSTKEDIDHLVKATRWFSENKGNTDLKEFIRIPQIPFQVYTPAEAFNQPYEQIPFKSADGQISKRIIAPYPPGIPYICPGEIITQNAVEMLTQMKLDGAVVQGIDENEMVEVITE
ncbi:MAG TPA: aminotransferase class V-fold PLP-dependent enzyme [Caldisericia bacterium]|jgi:lysine decarboxylase|nr:aminotransferase class V-fold PLP-dependent enzyme [Caldisericia bacterium]HXK51658.1 aminotransferase class V-fold PLP-dependent enzyme [Caldisericia bacterium]